MPRFIRSGSAARAVVAACESKPAEKVDSAAIAPVVDAPKSLHDRLGGTAAIATVVDAFVANVAGDTRINKRFSRVAGDTAAMRQFKQKLVDQVCEGTGDPCKYTGLDMKAAHKGMGLTDADFDALVEDLAKALDSAGVPTEGEGRTAGDSWSDAGRHGDQIAEVLS